MTPRLIQNALYFPDHDYYLISRHIHDYVIFEYLPGHIAMTDGGTSYIRRSVIPPAHNHLVVPYDLDESSPITEVQTRLLWGSLPLDKSLPQVHTHRPIRLLIKEHLAAILVNVPGLNPLHQEVIEHWLKIKSA